MKVLLYFTAKWCTPCKHVKPLLNEVVTEFPDVQVQLVDIDEQREVVRQYQVMSVPTLVNPVSGAKGNLQASREAIRYLIKELANA